MQGMLMQQSISLAYASFAQHTYLQKSEFFSYNDIMAYKCTLFRFVRYKARKTKKLTRTIASDVMKLCLKYIKKKEQKVTKKKKRIFSQGV
jgi:hypothetical protein